MYIKYFGPMPNGIFSCALSYQFYRKAMYNPVSIGDL